MFSLMKNLCLYIAEKVKMIRNRTDLPPLGKSSKSHTIIVSFARSCYRVIYGLRKIKEWHEIPIENLMLIAIALYFVLVPMRIYWSNRKETIINFYKQNKRAVPTLILCLANFYLRHFYGITLDEIYQQLLENPEQIIDFILGFLRAYLPTLKYKKPPINLRKNGLSEFDLAESGNTEAQYRLGKMYFVGKGVPRNYREAYIWLSLAATTNRKKKVIKALEEVEKKLTPADIIRAQGEALRRWEKIRKKQQWLEK